MCFLSLVQKNFVYFFDDFFHVNIQYFIIVQFINIIVDEFKRIGNDGSEFNRIFFKILKFIFIEGRVVAIREKSDEIKSSSKKNEESEN